MKNLLFVVALSIVLFSCKDDNNDNSNEFSYNSENYILSKAFIVDFDTNTNGSFDVDVFLTNDNVSFDTGVSDFIGFGDMVYLDLNTNSAGQLVSGTYNFSLTRNAFTLYDGNILVEYNFTSISGTEDEVVAGTVEVEVEEIPNGGSSGQSTIEFNLITTSGQEVNGYYKGVFEQLDL